MIKELSGLPDGVTGFEATGKLRAEDYRDVVLPALERAAAGGEVRFVVIGDFQACPVAPCGRTSRWARRRNRLGGGRVTARHPSQMGRWPAASLSDTGRLGD